jgi:hypothetical protein
VRAAGYPALKLAGLDRDVGLVARDGERPALAGLELRDVSGLRIEGFGITDISRIEDSEDVEIVGNDVSPHGFVLGGGRDVVLEGNDIHDLEIERPGPGATGDRCHPFGPTAGIAPRCGHAIRLNFGRGYTIRDNRFRTIPADGLQVLGTEDLLVEGNRFEGIAPTIDPAEHSDSIQFVGGTKGATIRDNVFVRARGIIAIPDDGPGEGTTTGLVIEDNVFAGPGHFAVSLNDTPDLRFVGNTAWGTSSGVVLREHPAEPYRMTGVHLVDNVIDHLEADPAMFAERHHNLLGEGTPGGEAEIVATPRFARDWALADGSPGKGAATDGADLGA